MTLDSTIASNPVAPAWLGRDGEPQAVNPLLRPIAPSPRWQMALAALLPVAVLWATHFPVLSFPMTRLDELVWSTCLKAHGTWYYFTHACDTGMYKVYRPVVLALLRVEYWVFGLQATGYHAMGLVYASLMLVLLWRLASRLSGSIWAASVAAVFVAINSQNSIAYSMIAESHNNPPSAVFFLAAVLTFFRFQQNGRWWLWAAAAIFAWLAIGCWEPGAAVLPAIVVIGWFGRRNRSIWWAMALAVGVFSVYLAMRHYALGQVVQEYARDDRGYFFKKWTDVLLSELDAGTRRALYVYTVAANVIGTMVPNLFAASGRIIPELNPWRRWNPEGARLWALGSQLLLMLAVLCGIRRRNWRSFAFVGLVLLATACASFVLYRTRNHMIGTLVYAALLAVVLADAARALGRAKSLRVAMLLVPLAASSLLFLRANWAAHEKLGRELRSTNVMDHPTPGHPYIIDEEIRRELYRRYPPEAATTAD